jgi:hypothetical protein
MLSIPFVSNGHTLDTQARQSLNSPHYPSVGSLNTYGARIAEAGPDYQRELPTFFVRLCAAFVPPLCRIVPLCAAARFVSHHRINTGISATIT